MGKIKTRLRTLKYKLKHDFLSLENVVLVAAIALCLVWTYQSIVAMNRNMELSRKLTAERKQLQLLNLEMQAAELENEYYESEEYQELAARKNLDKKLEGENMVVMPENSEEAKNKHAVTVTEVEEEEKYSNFEEWMMYLFPKY